MNFKKNYKGMLLCLIIAIPCWFLGKKFPIVGGPVFGIILGMIITLFIKDKNELQSGITFTSKKILQYAVILLGFGMNLSVVLQTGKQSLPIILATISTSLIVAYLLHKIMHIPSKISTLIGVGSSICGGSAIAATAPVIEASDEEVAQSISVIFLFNMIAALLFPTLGTLLGFSTKSGEAFGIFAGTAINDTSSVTAAASTWDSMYHLQSATTVAIKMGVSADFFTPFKELSKFFIVLAMVAIGLNTNVIKLIKNGGKPIILGFICWICIACMSLFMQHLLGIW